MALLDLLGRRWALRVLWELGEAGTESGVAFRELQRRCGDISPSVLNTRLKELREAGLVELVEGEGYRATRHALEMRELLLPLDDWARRWSRRIG